MAKYVYSIPKISCDHCVAAIKKGLNELEGVQQISGDTLAKTITVDARPPANDEQIKSRLAQIGYPVVS